MSCGEMTHEKLPVFLQAVQYFVIYSSVVLSPNKIRI